jgi:mono/diheme cytochrome c family protein
MALASGCAQEDLPQSVWDQRHPSSGSGQSSSQTSPDGQVAQGTCHAARAQPLPATLAATAAGLDASAPAAAVETVPTLVGRIESACGGGACHDSALGGFQITRPADLLGASGEGFATQGEWALAHIEGDQALPVPGKACTLGDPSSCQAMPEIAPGSPTGMPWTQRLQTQPDSAVVLLDQRLHQWIAAGKPLDQFSVPVTAAAAASAPFGVSRLVGDTLTNLGNCIPDPALVGTDTATMDALDAKFAAAARAAPGSGVAQEQVIGLPLRLSDTDLTTFDSTVLARTGVVAYVPGYPLWSDDAGKLRYVRVPRGTAIEFDKATQAFRIPPNTRFYKTFLKRIVDADGNPSYRKIETRLIVSRPDPAAATDQVQALYGAYQWNADETAATLVTEALNDGTGFKDQIFTYDCDVNAANDIRAAYSSNDPPLGTLDQALLSYRAVRHYAMPSSTRCVQCHMGSPSRSFVLGFAPLQIARRPVGQGGVIEPPGPDELTQLQRLIDYGVVQGIGAPTDVVPLEASQGHRTPRNEAELIAQGYVLGNCAHCHNPVGYPSFTFPELAASFDLWPSATGGLFQFPLEKFSPRIQRGVQGDVAIPYITPSLLDNPSYPTGQALDPNIGDVQLLAGVEGTSVWLPKWQGRDGIGDGFVYAPWRSLIYRNVDTPFSYTDDYAIYPHMPMNTAGFDLRAKQILGSWMVSIPAVRKRPDMDEYVYPYAITLDTKLFSTDDAYYVSESDTSPQPYVEVLPDDPRYEGAIAAAEARLAIFGSGFRQGDAQNFGSRATASPDTSDIVDPEVDLTCHPIPTEHENPLINVPTHAHWVSIDLTVSSSDWAPQSDWEDAIVAHQPGPSASAACGSAAADNQRLQTVVDLLPQLQLDGPVNVPHDANIQTVRDFVSQQVPFGLWVEEPGCDFTGIPTVAQARAPATHRGWLDGPQGADGTRHVYSESAGAAIFGMVCINCHGPNADSHGRLADNLALMTGGHAQVADFRDGLFGPRSTPGQNRLSVFGAGASAGATSSTQQAWANLWTAPYESFLAAGATEQQWADTWGARYMAFMALGGTEAIIPSSFLANVSHQPFFGELRSAFFDAQTVGANMLSIARSLCLTTLATPPFNATTGEGYLASHANVTGQSLLFDNGDAQMWLELCALNNPPPVVAYERQDLSLPPEMVLNAADVSNWTGFLHANTPSIPPVILPSAFLAGDGAAAATGIVGDQDGRLSATLGAQNLHPWCVGDFLHKGLPECVGGADCLNGTCKGADCLGVPLCPASVTTPAVEGGKAWDDASATAALTWATRGAINAAIAVFLYLDELTRSGQAPQPTYNHCELLTSPGANDAGIGD